MGEVGGRENLAKHYNQTSFFGVADVLRHLRTIFSQLDECKRDIVAFGPDVVIHIDYPGFNFKVAKFAHSMGIPTFYYISPKVWAWKERRVEMIRKWVDRLFIIFPFEREYFRKRGIEAHYEGNPIMDSIAQTLAEVPSKEQFALENGLDSRPIVSLLAGSRKNEIKKNLAFMVALSKVHPEWQFVVAGVSWLDKGLYEQFLEGSDVKVLIDKTYALLKYSDAAVVCSGTATLETALIGIPELVVYGIPWLYEKVKPYLLKIPFVSLVNINMGREVVREMVVYKPSVDEAEQELRALLPGGNKREQMLKDFDELRTLIGGAGASDRFAADIVQTIKTK
jgi:lipid-A-disaccharide synthase